MSECHFNLINDSGANLDEKRLRRCAEVVCAGERAQGECEINLQICTDGEMRQYNRLYRGDDSITDVLAFSAEDENLIKPGDGSLPCDIIIDINQLDRQKGTNKLEDELMEVFIHGLLHAFGYDHIRRQDRNIMEEKEIAYKQIMGGTK
ncbi:MAG: rRNA maturation RNase YbeY [Candidatus Syntrophosphaera sp.]